MYVCECGKYPFNPFTQKTNGYDLLKIRLRNFCQQRDLEMSISESGPCSQLKHGLWEEKCGLWSLLTGVSIRRENIE